MNYLLHSDQLYICCVVSLYLLINILSGESRVYVNSNLKPIANWGCSTWTHKVPLVKLVWHYRKVK